MRRARAAMAARVLVGCAVLTLCAPLLRGAAAAAPPAAPSLGTVVIADPAPGYAVSSEGPLDPAEFAARSPDPAATAGALATLVRARTVSTYERVWEDDGGANQVQDVLVHFPSVVGAQAFVRVAQRALESGAVVSSGPLAPLPGARRTVYFASSTGAGVGQAITMRSGPYVDLLSFFSAASGHTEPVSPAEALRVARAQHGAIVSAPGGTVPAGGGAARGRASDAALVWAALAVAVLAAAVATPAVLRRQRARALGSTPERRADQRVLPDA